MSGSYIFTLFAKKGELLIVNNILIVGSSILILGRALGSSKLVIVSPISKSSNPIIAQISPELILSIGFFSKPLNSYNSLILTFYSYCYFDIKYILNLFYFCV